MSFGKEIRTALALLIAGGTACCAEAPPKQVSPDSTPTPMSSPAAGALPSADEVMQATNEAMSATPTSPETNMVPDIGPVLSRKMIETFDKTSAVYTDSVKQLDRVAVVCQKYIEGFVPGSEKFTRVSDTEWLSLCRIENGGNIVAEKIDQDPATGKMSQELINKELLRSVDGRFIGYVDKDGVAKAIYIRDGETGNKYVPATDPSVAPLAPELKLQLPGDFFGAEPVQAAAPEETAVPTAEAVVDVKKVVAEMAPIDAKTGAAEIAALPIDVAMEAWLAGKITVEGMGLNTTTDNRDAQISFGSANITELQDNTKMVYDFPAINLGKYTNAEGKELLLLGVASKTERGLILSDPANSNNKGWATVRDGVIRISETNINPHKTNDTDYAKSAFAAKGSLIMASENCDANSGELLKKFSIGGEDFSFIENGEHFNDQNLSEEERRNLKNWAELTMVIFVKVDAANGALSDENKAILLKIQNKDSTAEADLFPLAQESARTESLYTKTCKWVAGEPVADIKGSVALTPDDLINLYSGSYKMIGLAVQNN